MSGFLVDSCIAIFAVNALREAGHSVEWVPEGGKDPGDEAIIQKAFDESLVLVTADKDFGDLVFVFGKPQPAIIRLVDIRPKDQGKVLLRLLETHMADIENKAIITVSERRIRVRRVDEANSQS
jgi:predicted nuclease of predicted toxin-antitoxin system